jgi:hypothetical protein
MKHAWYKVISTKYIFERGHKTAGWGNQFDVYLGASRRGFASTVLSRERDDDNTTRPKHYYYAITNQLLTYAVGGREGWVRRTSGLEIVIVSTACIEQ